MPGENSAPPKRHYPPIYERIIPLALGLIGVAMIVLLVIIVVVLASAR